MNSFCCYDFVYLIFSLQKSYFRSLKSSNNYFIGLSGHKESPKPERNMPTISHLLNDCQSKPLEPISDLRSPTNEIFQKNNGLLQAFPSLLIPPQFFPGPSTRNACTQAKKYCPSRRRYKYEFPVLVCHAEMSMHCL